MADLKTTARLQMLADIIAEQSGTIMEQAHQIGRLNEMLQQERQEKEALKKAETEVVK